MIDSTQHSVEDSPVPLGQGLARWIVPNLFLCLGMLVLGAANFVLHSRYPVFIAWLPSGLAFGAILLRGPIVLPGIALGSAGLILVMLGDVWAALIFGAANAAACLFGRFLARLGKPISLADHAVSDAARVLFSGGFAFALAAFLLGPYSIAQLIEHEPGTAHVQHLAPSLPNAADSAGSAHHGHSSAALQERNADLQEQLLIDLIGILLVMPAVLRSARPRSNVVPGMREDHRSAVAVFALLSSVTLAIYSGYLAENFGFVHTTLLVLPPAVWLALKFDSAYTMLGNAVVLLMMSVGTALGHGPFSDHSSGLPLVNVVFTLTTLLVAASHSERKAAEKTIRRMAKQDALTGIPNRALLAERLTQALYSAQRYERKVALMFIDLDHFKRVNDTLGHHVGDLLLIEVSQRILGCLRKDSLLARFGGDEFVVLIEHVEDRQSVSAVAERIASAVAHPFEIDSHLCDVACSVGISMYPEDGDAASELMMKADIAMYAVKNRGRNGFSFYSSEMRVGAEPEVKAAELR